MTKILPENFAEKIGKIVAGNETPFYFYDEKILKNRAKNLLETARKFFPDFENFFAVKANPNPKLLQIWQDCGCGFDCASIPELEIAAKLNSRKMMFSANFTPKKEFAKARQVGAIVNLDHPNDFANLQNCGESLPEILSFRFNPGERNLADNNFVTGKLNESKFGATGEQILRGIETAKNAGVKRFGLHAFLGSNVLDENYFVETAEILFDLAAEIFQKFSVEIEFINTSGGLGVPYLPSESELDLEKIFSGIRRVFDEKSAKFSIRCPNLFMESGRWLSAPAGFLISKIVARKEIFNKKYAGLDASMANLMRPGLYGAFHEMSVWRDGTILPNCHSELVSESGKKISNQFRDDKNNLEKINVVGPLCENNDFFARDRDLPKLQIGDILILHDAGGHGFAMGFQYNGRLRCAEFLARENGEIEKIRRAETSADYFQTAVEI